MNKCWSFARMVSGVSAIVLGTALVSSAQETGVKQIQELIKSANTSVKSINDTKLQLEKTMAAYNTVLSPDVKDRQDAYKKLQKEMENADKRRADVSKRAGEMNAEADKLFKSWEGSTAAIQDPDLRQRSQLRLTTAKDRFSTIRLTGQNASALYTPFMKTLQDQVTFLGHDLNPSAVANLKPDGEKLNAQARELYTAIDQTMAAANDNIGRLSAQ
ncbi:MAG TPA: DUF2959 family protein [Vicinamibacterales bacterium]|nr:DUF2959 family protein [Vicinamibacterales bacterium]